MELSVTGQDFILPLALLAVCRGNSTWLKFIGVLIAGIGRGAKGVELNYDIGSGLMDG